MIPVVGPSFSTLYYSFLSDHADRQTHTQADRLIDPEADAAKRFTPVGVSNIETVRPADSHCSAVERNRGLTVD